MSKYSSDSDNDDYKGKISRRKRRRSNSSSSRDSHVKSSKRRSRKSRSYSRDRSTKTSHRDKRSSVKEKSRTHRSRSPYRNRSRSRRKYRSISRSRSRSRSRGSSTSYGKKKSHSKSKRNYKSRSRSHSYHRKSRSHSRRSNRSRSRSSSSPRKYRRSPIGRNDRETSNSSDDCVVLEGKQLQDSQKKGAKNVDSKRYVKQESFSSFDSSHLITIPSDDPIVKQEQIDDINASSFTPKAFKSSKTLISNHNDKNPGLGNVKMEHNLNNICAGTYVEGFVTINGEDDLEKRKNDTVFHDSIAFEDSEQKIQKWVKKLFTLRQKFLLGYSNREKKEI